MTGTDGITLQMRHTLFVFLVLLPMTTFASGEFVVKDMRVEGLQRMEAAKSLGEETIVGIKVQARRR